MHAHPLTRVVCGLPTSWDQSIASVGFPSPITRVIWSPCSRLVAIVSSEFMQGQVIEILDAVTLGRHSIFPLHPPHSTSDLTFSPDTRLLTSIGRVSHEIITWDIQTGVLVSVISPEDPKDPIYVGATYSTCGTIIGLHYYGWKKISTYNILSGEHISSLSVEGIWLRVWAHDEYLKFALLKPEAITVYKVGTTSTHTLTEVESLPLPDNFVNTPVLCYHPALSRLAYGGGVCIWDARHSEHLLTFQGFCTQPGSFSSSGHFFCGIVDSGVYLWKESLTGYILHQRIPTTASNVEACISPNGEFVLTYGVSTAQLWSITDSSITSPTIPTQASQREERSPLAVFSPDEALAAVKQIESMTVTVLDLKSGVPRLIIDTGIEVYGLGIAGGTIVIIGYDPVIDDKKIVTWNSSASNCGLTSRANIDDSVGTTIFYDPPTAEEKLLLPVASVSSDLHYFIMMEKKFVPQSSVHLYDMLTGQCLASVSEVCGWNFWFTLNGCCVWCIDEYHLDCGWKVTKESESGITSLERLACPPSELPWQCPPGYWVRNEWIFHSTGKQLLWLPPQWWPVKWDRVWGGQFLALLDSGLPEVLILDLE